MVVKATHALVLAAVLALGGGVAVGVQGALTVDGQCLGDANGDAKVTVDELVMAVNNALNGCPMLPITLQFRAMVGDQPFACGQHYTGIGTSGSEIIPSDFRVYIHDIRLVSSSADDVPVALDQDEVWQIDDVVLLDFADQTGTCFLGTAGTNSVVRGTVPPGEYRGVRFTIGVPFALNHPPNMAAATCPLCVTGMFWSWQAGYKFLRFDAAPDNAGVHVGSTGCEYGTGTPPAIDHCARPNRGEVFLDGFDPLHDVIIADLAALLADSDLTVNQAGPAGCLSDPDDLDCTPIFRNLGMDFSTGHARPDHANVLPGGMTGVPGSLGGARGGASARWLFVAAVLLVGVAVGTQPVEAAPWKWHLPRGFPIPKVPSDNPMSEEKVALGRLLFYDTRLSGNETYSCGSCHQQERAFTDGRAQAIGSTGELHPRSTMTLTNVAYSPTLAWADSLLRDLEIQALTPMFDLGPTVELGLQGREDELIDRLNADLRYQRLFAEAFPDQEDRVSIDTITKAIASFVRTLISGNSPFDRYVNGLDDNAISPSALRGANLFLNTERIECAHCHGAFNLAGPFVHQGQTMLEGDPFFNTALYNIDGDGSYPRGNEGLKEITGRRCDEGRFKTVTLRNIAVTAPYMHDGSIATLEEVMDHYGVGGRTITEGPFAGVGSENPYKGACDPACQTFPCPFSVFIKGFTITPEEKEDVINFLKSLTDEDFLKNPRLSDPFTHPACVGDCNEDAEVSVSELVTSINMALGRGTLAQCVPADRDADGEPTVDELVAAVDAAVNGCP